MVAKYLHKQKCVFNNFWKRIADYNNGFKEDMYIYVHIYDIQCFISLIYFYPRTVLS